MVWPASVDSLVPAPPPPEWARAQDSMGDFVRRWPVTVPDDKEPGRAWGASSAEVAVEFMLGRFLAVSPPWKLKPELNAQTVEVMEASRAQAALPARLLRGGRGAAQKRPQLASPLVKSKCVGPDGQRVCDRPGHWCWRRVLDQGGVPYASAWKVSARAVVAVARDSGCTSEAYGLDQLRPCLERALDGLTAAVPWSCITCGCNLGPEMTIVTGDLYQAYEACDAGGVETHWPAFEQAYREKHGHGEVRVLKGRRVLTSTTGSGPLAKWHLLSLEELRRALVGYCLWNIVILAGVVLSGSGLGIGGVASFAALCVVLGGKEREWRGAPKPHLGMVGLPSKYTAWGRYVDDVAAVSRVQCGRSVARAVQECFLPLSLTIMAGTTEKGNAPHRWADSVLVPVGRHALELRPWNPNRWLSNPGAPPWTASPAMARHPPKGLVDYAGPLGVSAGSGGPAGLQ